MMALYGVVLWLCLLLEALSKVITGANCSSGLPSISELTAPSLSTEALPPDSELIQQWIFPGLRFTCSGNLTRWIFRAENATSDLATNSPPRFEVWSDFLDTELVQNDFDRKHAATQRLELLRYQSASEPVYEYRLPTPIPVEENDLLGIFYPVAGFESLKVLFLDLREGNAPVSYRRNQNIDFFLASISSVRTDDRYVPLVSAVLEMPEGSTTVAILPASTSQPRESSVSPSLSPSQTDNLSSPSLEETAIVLPLSVSTTPISPMQPTPQPSFTDSPTPTSAPSNTPTATVRRPVTPGGTNVGLIVGVTVAILFTIFLATVISIVMMCLMMRQRRKRRYTSATAAATSNGQLDNPVYLGVESQPTDKTQSSGTYHLYALPTQVVSPAPPPSSNGVRTIEATIAEHYEFADEVLPNGLGTESHYEMEPFTEATVPATALPGQYEVPLSALSNYRSEEMDSPMNHEYSVLDQGIYVPTEEERRILQSNTSQSGLFDDNIYSRWSKKYKNRLKDGMYFQEENVYWKPASSKTALYDQLAERKYREILRHQIQIIQHLGAGQFGTVNKGLWQSHYGTEEVAVKTLQQKASEADKVKFLQEAAIMGQFLHSNVVKLHGVVTVGEPVMIVIEYMPKGDLRNYLRSRRPQPGEMIPAEIPELLLKFCREIASGMNYLSNKAFVHRDLAARNILVAADNTCKIGDFGMSRDLEDNNYYITHGGKIPVKWTAPEALNFRKYSTASDVWSFGALMYEIWSLGHKPFEGYTNHQVFQLLASGFRLPPPPGCPRPMYGLMIRCWHSDATVRPMFSAVVNMLSHSDSHLLSWTDTDRQGPSQATCLGAPLQAGEDLYQDLQDYYIDKH